LGQLAAIEAEMIEKATKEPRTSTSELVSWAHTEHGVQVSTAHLATFLRERGLTRRHRKKSSVAFCHRHEIRALIERRPDITYREIADWLETQNVKIGLQAVMIGMKRAGIEKVSQGSLAKKQRRTAT
jgi:transposase